MKIVIFAPHPDDEIYGCGGSILKWMEEGHDLHIIYVTDNCALITWGKKKDQLIEDCANEFLHLSEEEIGKIGLQEAVLVAKNFGFLDSNVHLFKFHDQDAANQIQKGVELTKEIVKDADRLVIPSDNNNHTDHQATQDMAKKAASELNLDKVEFYVYAIYNILKIPLDKQVKIKIAPYRTQIYELMKGYRTQLCLKTSRMGWETFKRKRIERFGVFSLNDANKFPNF